MKVYFKQPAVMDDNVTPFTKDKFAGWTISIDGKPAVAIPLQWDGKPDTQYEFDLAALELPDGPHELVMRTTETDGDLSPASPVYKFTQKVVPQPPLVESVA